MVWRRSPDSAWKIFSRESIPLDATTKITYNRNGRGGGRGQRRGTRALNVDRDDGERGGVNGLQRFIVRRGKNIDSTYMAGVRRRRIDSQRTSTRGRKTSGPIRTDAQKKRKVKHNIKNNKKRERRREGEEGPSTEAVTILSLRQTALQTSLVCVVESRCCTSNYIECRINGNAVRERSKKVGKRSKTSLPLAQ